MYATPAIVAHSSHYVDKQPPAITTDSAWKSNQTIGVDLSQNATTSCQYALCTAEAIITLFTHAHGVINTYA